MYLMHLASMGTRCTSNCGSYNGKLGLVKPEDDGVIWMCFWLSSDDYIAVGEVVVTPINVGEGNG